MILMIDNYDSFTYNIVQYLGELGVNVKVVRNDMISTKDIEYMEPEKIVISPGPCTPKEAGVSIETINHFYTKLPILGICLGHQSIGAAFGGKIIKAKKIMHGKTSLIHHNQKYIPPVIKTILDFSLSIKIFCQIIDLLCYLANYIIH